MFAAQTFGVTPDVIVCGKGLSSGVVPLGCMVAREEMAAAFQGEGDTTRFFAHGHTFANCPLACAVGSARRRSLLTFHGNFTHAPRVPSPHAVTTL